tara:strand:- start:510 stop:641 length:132 start_codon:yes stop_codon:yes gene_type:complete
MKHIQKLFKKILLENVELKKQIKVLETILRSYLPILKRRKDDI